MELRIDMRVFVGRDGKECVGKGLCQDLVYIGKPTDAQDPFLGRRWIVARIDLGRGYVQLAEPDRWVSRVEGHEPIVQQPCGKQNWRRPESGRVLSSEF